MLRSNRSHTRVLFAVACVAVVAIAFVGGCSRTQRAQSDAAGPTVTITANGYSPRVLTVAEGETVTWRNADTVAHVVSGSGFVSGRIAAGATFAHKFAVAGTYQYLDTTNPSLEGVLVVR